MTGNASPRFRPGWNMSACTFSTRWFFLHGMYGWMTLNLAGIVVVALPALVYERWTWYVLGGYLVLSYGVLPATSDWLHARHLALHGTAEEEKRPWTVLGSVAIWLAWTVTWLVLIGGVFLREFADDPHRQRVMVGSNSAYQLIGRIQDFYDKHRRYPDAAEAAALIPPAPMHYGNVAWDTGEKRVVVTFVVGPIEGKRLIIHSREHRGALQWKCSYDLPERFGRKVCEKSGG